LRFIEFKRVYNMSNLPSQQYWNFPDHIAHISTCNDKQYPDIAFVLTQDGTLWKIESLAAVEYVNRYGLRIFKK
jgi:hypothetical protein